MSYMDQPPVGGAVPSQDMPGTPTFTLAPWIKRVAAYMVDWVIGAAIILVGVITSKTGLIALMYLVALVFQLWNYVWLQGTTGQTIGKRVAGIKVVREVDAGMIGPAVSFGRGICHILDGIPFCIGYLWPLWD